jgi:site-specific DNA recombinase
MNTPAWSVGFYARVSSEKQARERTIDSQLAELGARAQADGVEAPPELTFIDDGYSGAELLRPALERLRDTAAAGALDRLYILCPDRLARDFAHQVLLIDEFHRAGVEVVFLNHHLDDSPEGNLLLQIQGVIAQYERSKIRECARRGRLHAARGGALSVLGGAPYGYRYINKSDGGGRAAYHIVLDEARVVRQIFDWVGREGCSLGAAIRRLKSQGIPTSTGKPVWDRATLRDLLKNAAYKGAAEYGKTRRVERRPRLRPRRGQPEFPRRNRCHRATTADERILIPVPALVDEATFTAVQEQLARNREHHGRPAVAGRYLVQGLPVCARCGRAYYGKTSGGRESPGRMGGYRYYRCMGTDARRFDNQQMCSNRMIRVDRLDAAVWEDVRGLLLEPERIQAEYRRRLAAQGSTSDPDHKALGQQIQGVKRRIARLTEMYEEGFLEREVFRARMTAAQARLDTLQAESRRAAERETSESELRAVIGHLKAFAERLQTGLDQCDWETRQAIIRALVKRIVIGENDVQVVYKVSPHPFEAAPQGWGVLHYCWRSPAALQAAGVWGDVPRTPGFTRGWAPAALQAEDRLSLCAIQP